MKKFLLYSTASLVLIQFFIGISSSPPSLAQEWKVREEPRGTLRLVDLHQPSVSAVGHYAQALVGSDKDNNLVPRLAEDWRWIDDRTIEFKLREGVRFHNGEKFNAEAVRINWEHYRSLKYPTVLRFQNLPDETKLQVNNKYTVRFIFPEPDGLALVKFWGFSQFSPAFCAEHQFDEGNWGFLSEPGPWGAGAFKLVEGGSRYGIPSDRIVLEAYEGYWDRRYPKVQRLIFENTLIANRKEAMRLCRETEGEVDIVSNIRPE